MTTYEQIRDHHEQHIFQRGRYKGDAPADSSRRSKSHFRIIKLSDGVYAVWFHATDILTYYPSGTVVVNAGGWEQSPTTREAFAQFGVYLSTERLNGYKNTCVGFLGRANTPVPYVRGMTYNTFTKRIEHPDEGGKFLLKRYVSDRAARKSFSELAAPFRAMLPVLAAVRPNYNLMSSGPVWHGLASNPKATIIDTEMWPQLVATFWSPDGHKAIWQTIYKYVTRNMRNVESTVVDPNA